MLRTAPWLAAWAIAQGLYSQQAALQNYYVVNGDTPSAIAWLQRFRDPTLFRNDLLTDLAAQIHGQPGFVLFYGALAPLIDPLALSRILPIALLAVFAVYVWRFVRRFSTPFAAVLTAGIAIVAPTYMNILSGGHQRAFALPMLVAFLYYVAVAAWKRACLVLALQALFYPMAFLLCVPTYGLAWAFRWLRGQSSRHGYAPVLLFAVVVLACGTLLAVKNVYAPDPRIGQIVTRAQMEGRPEFYAGGRTEVLPTAGLVLEVKAQLTGLLRALSLGYGTGLARWVPSTLPFLGFGLLVAIAACAVIVGRAAVRGAVVFPPVLAYFLATGVALYLAADVLLFRLYLPNRYLIYTIQTAGLIVVGIAAGYLLTLIRGRRARAAVQLTLLALVATRFDLTRGIGLTNQERGRPLFEFLRTLPKDAVIASHPDAADFIPTFARRIVLLNFELSYPFHDVYWRTITERTRAFFDAYYAARRRDVWEFCTRYGVSHLIVRQRDFDPGYVARHRIYFEPFEQYARARWQATREHTLAGVGAGEMLFRDGDVFVVSRNVFRPVAPGRRSDPTVLPAESRALSGAPLP